ncbi:MAG: hypothetical protein J6P31_03260 [Oscillospiraceae bacterium]|nr:hypothetical protein [Oscillospiraceae bacterium]
MKRIRLPRLILAAIAAAVLALPVLAAAGTTAAVPVTLTVNNSCQAVSVTMPASLPVEIRNGTVITADSARIINRSGSSSVRVTAVSVEDGSYRVGDYENFSGRKTIALKINGCPTWGAGSLAITEKAFPVIGPEKELALTYFARISGDAPDGENTQAAHVVFTVSLCD